MRRFSVALGVLLLALYLGALFYISAPSHAADPNGVTSDSNAAASMSVDVQNAAPTVDLLSTASSTSEGSSGSTLKTFSITGVVSDNNGEDDLDTVSLVFYKLGVAGDGSCDANVNDCYRVPVCALDKTYGSDTQASYTCAVSTDSSYANGTWVAEVGVQDMSQAHGTFAVEVEMGTLSIVELPAQPIDSGGGIAGLFGKQYTILQVPTVTATSSGQPISTAVRTPTQSAPSQNTFMQQAITLFFQRLGLPEQSGRDQVDHVESYNAPLAVEPYQTGLSVFDFGAGSIMASGTRAAVVQIPRHAAARTLRINVNIQPSTVVAVLPTLQVGTARMVGKVLFDVIAMDDAGALVHSFAVPLTITLVVPEDLRSAKELGLYYLDEGTRQWVPVSGAIFGDTSVSFTVDHLTRFALFVAEETSPGVVSTTTSHPQYSWLLFWISLLLLLLLIILVFVVRRMEEDGEQEVLGE